MPTLITSPGAVPIENKSRVKSMSGRSVEAERLVSVGYRSIGQGREGPAHNYVVAVVL